MSDTKDRKNMHIDVCLNNYVQARLVKTGFDDIFLVHKSLPELSFDDIDLLIMGETLGLQTQSELFLAADFRLDWTLWPPVEWNLEASGFFDFSTINIELFLC